MACGVSVSWGVVMEWDRGRAYGLFGTLDVVHTNNSEGGDETGSEEG